MWWWSDTLLGPEGTSVSVLAGWLVGVGVWFFGCACLSGWVSRLCRADILLPLWLSGWRVFPRFRGCGGGCWWGVGVWLLFENYTVDASIFVVK